MRVLDFIFYLFGVSRFQAPGSDFMVQGLELGASP